MKIVNKLNLTTISLILFNIIFITNQYFYFTVNHFLLLILFFGSLHITGLALLSFNTDILEEYPYCKKILLPTFFGIVISSLIYLTIGNFGFKISILYYNLILLISSGILIKNKYRFKIKIKKISSSLLFLLPLILLFIFIIYIISKSNLAHWDELNFWWLDPKELFFKEYFTLNPNGYDSTAIYSSYFSIPAFLLYNIFNGIFEQYTLYISLFYMLCISGLLVEYSNKNKQTVVLTILFIISFMADRSFWILSYYADLAMGLYVLIMYLLIENSKKNNIILFLLLLVSFCFIKSTNYVYTIFIFILFLIKNYKNLLNYNLLSKFNISILTLSILSILSSVYYSNFIFINNYTITSLVSHRINLLSTSYFFSKNKELILFLLSEYFLTFISLLIFLSLLKMNKIKKNDYYLFLLIIILPLINYAHYYITDYHLVSKSLSRYVMTTLPLIPIFLIKICRGGFSLKIYTKVSLFLLSILIFINFYFINQIVFKYNYNLGVFKNYQEYKIKIIRSALEKSDNFILLTDFSENRVTTGNHMLISIRYGLADKNFSRFLGLLSYSELNEFLFKNRINKVFLIKPSTTLLKLLKAGSFYKDFIQLDNEIIQINFEID